MAGRAASLIAVIDASVFVSAALKAGSIPERALLSVLEKPNRLITSPDVEAEYREVIFRPKFDRASIQRRQFVVGIVLSAAERIKHVTHVYECPDPKDDKYLSLAASGKADVIVTGDTRHLLSMHPWRGISILSPADFLALP